MFLQPSQLAGLAALATVQLAETPFPVLLLAHHAAESTGLLVARRGPIEKRVVLVRGVPVDCRSNLAHETFSRFLAASGRLSEAEAHGVLTRSVARGALLGEVLVAEGLMDAAELHRLLQQSLARKLFDLFTWRDGEITFEAGEFATAAALKVKVARLVLTGVERFVPQETIDSAIGPLAGTLLALPPDAATRVEELRPSEREKALLGALVQPRRLEELLPLCALSVPELSRTIWGLALLGLVVPADRLAAPGRSPAASPIPPAVEPVLAPPAAWIEIEDPIARESARLQEEVARAFASFRGQDAFELLAANRDATDDEIRACFLAFARRFAPWQFERRELEQAAPAARELFIAGALAFARLCDSHERAALRSPHPLSAPSPVSPSTPAAPSPLAAAVPRPSPSPLRIETDLLDAALQYKKGRALKEAKRWVQARKQFEFAADCDPQNGAYRAEAAHCGFLLAPTTAGAKALAELEEAQRIDPESITPYLYAGEIATQLGRFSEAETYLRTAARRLGPEDRRALDALRELAKKRKK